MLGLLRLAGTVALVVWGARAVGDAVESTGDGAEAGGNAAVKFALAAGIGVAVFYGAKKAKLIK